MLTLTSPIDGALYAQRPPLRVQEAVAAIARAREAQRDWRALPLAQRIAIVRGFVAALGAMEAQMTPELAWQMGRPVRFGGEMAGVRERSEHMAAIAEAALAPSVIERSAAAARVMTREPLGVVMAIAPWNYPYLTAINTIAPALIAGNAVILKHATQTMLAGERFQMAADASALPAHLFCNLALDHATTEALLAAGQVDFVNFTGSVGGGRAIERACAGAFTGVSLELGGKDPGYVAADADVARAAAGLIDGAMFNSGQCCCGIERIYVHEAVFDRFVEAAVALANGYVLGNPLDADTTLGPMAQPRLAELVRAQVADAVRKGARALIDPRRFAMDKPGSPYLAPQILIGVDHAMELMREENFGPVVGIMKVKDDAEAIALMNDSAYGLTASIWTGDIARAERIGQALDTGTVFMNRCDYLDPALCWSGRKNSGRGASLSSIAYLTLTRPKSYHLRT